MIILNLLALIFIAVVSASFCKKSWLRATVSVLFGVFLCMEIGSLYLGGTFCDYRFFAHFNFRDFWWGATSLFKIQAILLPVVLASICVGISIVAKWLLLKNKSCFLFIKLGILAGSLLFLLTTKNGIASGLKEAYILRSASITEDNFNNILSDIETKLSSSDHHISFTRKEDLTASSGKKNIVIISLESFETAFLHDKNQGLTPNLRQLKHEWNYFPMAQNNGSSWTIGSLYTSFTGLPCFFVGSGNKALQNTQESKIINLGDVLKLAGYETYHLSENANFAGTRNLLSAFGIQHILDKTIPTDSDKVRDLDIFNKAKDILKNASPDQPAMIHISTISTHWPKGDLDSRLNDKVEQQKTDLETAVKQSDYLVGDFINSLKEDGLLEHTIVYIFPDHLFLGNNYDIIEKTGEERSLWFLTNADSKELNIDTTNFYQIDLPHNILSGAKIQHNATFLSDFIKTDKGNFVDQHVNLLAFLNTSSISREKILSNRFEVFIHKGNVVCLIDNNVLFTDPVKALKEHDRLIVFTDELKIQDVVLLEKDDYSFDPSYPYDFYVRTQIKNDQLYVSWEKDSIKTFSETSRLELDFADIEQVYASITQRFVNITMRNVEQGFVKNLPQDSVLIDYLQKTLKDPQNVIAVAAIDDASIYFDRLKPILKAVGLKKTLVDHFRWSYISVFSKNKVYVEKTTKRPVQETLVIDGTTLEIASSGGFEYNVGYIIINDKNYMLSSKEFGGKPRGLNFVIFNTQTKTVKDAFYVDFYGDETLKINR